MSLFTIWLLFTYIFLSNVRCVPSSCFSAFIQSVDNFSIIFFFFLYGAVFFLRLSTESTLLYAMPLPNPYRSCSDKSPLREWDPGPAMRSAGVLPTLHPNHRVYRVPGFFSSCPNWVHHTPSPARECLLPSLGPIGETDSLAREGLGDPIPKKGHILW